MVHRFRLIVVSLVLGFSGSMGFVMAYRTVRFDMTPGEEAREKGNTAGRWPAASRISRDSHRPTLVLFAHPYCSCTRATLAELAKVIDSPGAGRVALRVLFSRPGGRDWKQNDLWDQAARLPETLISWDENGREAKLFGARTSGLAVLYSPDGKLAFRGGLTASRGHIGDNAGSAELIRAIQSGHPVARHFFVFGCSLLGAMN